MRLSWSRGVSRILVCSYTLRRGLSRVFFCIKLLALPRFKKKLEMPHIFRELVDSLVEGAPGPEDMWSDGGNSS